MEILGYIAALFIGLTLGLTGAGGSILTVPILVYLFGVDPIQSTAYSLFIVGSVASVGAIDSYKKKEINSSSVLFFGIPSVISIFITRKFLVPHFPQVLLEWRNFQLDTDKAILLLFAILMILAAWRMIVKRRAEEVQENSDVHVSFLLFIGIVVGFITGILGAGGGFLIIPALIFYAGLDMKRAVGTSLLIISFNALIGFAGDVIEREIEWRFLLFITALAIVGIMVGMKLKTKVNGKALKITFGYLIFIIAIWILISELMVFF